MYSVFTVYTYIFAYRKDEEMVSSERALIVYI